MIIQNLRPRNLSIKQRVAAVTLAVTVGLASTGGVAFAAGLTNVLLGKATTSTPGVPFPIEVLGMQPVACPTLPPPYPAPVAPCLAVTYHYQARGLALGDLPGRFVYDENGVVTVDAKFAPAANSLKSAVFNIDPIARGPNVVLTYTSVIPGGGIVPPLDTLPRAVQAILKYLGVKAGDPYITFTYNDKCGTHTGYAKADSSVMGIAIKFNC